MRCIRYYEYSAFLLQNNGDRPNILALPLTFKTTSVHLCMKDPARDCMDEYGHRHGCGCC